MRAENRVSRKFRRGSHDGEVMYLPWWQNVIYLAAKINLDYYEKLKVTESVCWKPPEDVYRLGEDGQFHYDKTVHYEPEAFFQSGE